MLSCTRQRWPSVHCFRKSAVEKKMKMKRKEPNYKRRRQRQRFNFSCRARLIRRSAAQRLSHPSQGGGGGERGKLVSLLDAEGPNVPFKVCFVLFLPGKNDFPFRLLVGKVEWNIKWRPWDKPAVKYGTARRLETCSSPALTGQGSTIVLLASGLYWWSRTMGIIF